MTTKKEMHAYVIKMTVFLFVFPLIVFLSLFKLGCKPMYCCISSVFIFSYILLKLVLAIVRKYQVRNKRKIKKLQ